MKKIVMVIAQDKFRDEELAVPKAIFEEKGYTVKIASTTKKDVVGMLGMKVKPDMFIQDIKETDFDALVFVGGLGAQQYWNDPIAHKLAWDFASKNKIVSAICIAPVILANAGLLKGKRATVWASEMARLIEAKAQYTNNPVERDGVVITAAGPFAAEEFGKEIVKALSE
ncbi:MAG: DJ-1/PfpI family protein [Candidatus Omnitrophica bacterium]|nr:DJ-1/PfpI family protein [Candidatus Omnitrophota bacterium]